MNFLKFFFIFLFSIIVLGLNSAIKVKILFTCDNNGRPLSFTEMQADNQGGMPARSSLMKKIIGGDKKKSNTLILDTGSVFIGRPESDLFNGETDIAGMNAIGYDAVAVGITEIMRTKKDFDKLNNLAEFYYISSNLFFKTQTEKEELIADDYFIKKFGNVTIGIFSVITEDALNQLPSQYRQNYIIKNPLKVSKEMVDLLINKKKVDIVIALTHLGYYEDNYKIGSQTLANLVKGIDLIIDGVTGLNLKEPILIGDTKIFQVMKWGLYVGEIDLTIENKKIININYKIHPVNYKENGELVGEKIEEDVKVLEAINKKMKNYNNLIKTKLTTIEKGKKLITEGIRERETELGNFICDAILDYTKADVAFQNAGGIEQGEIGSNITRETFNNIIKYDNSIVIVNLTGKEIKEILSYSMERIGYGAFLQVSGISFIYSKSKKNFKIIKIKNKEIEDETIYKVAINSWLANGGDGYKIFINKKNRIDYKKIIREVVYDYSAKQKILKPIISNRIVIEE